MNQQASKQPFGERFRRRLDTPGVAGTLFSMPFIIGFFLFTLVPMLISLYYSFCNYDILNPPVFSGLYNFVKMFSTKDFFDSLKATMYFAFVSVPLKLIFALLVALLLVRKSHMTGIYRAVYYIPSHLGGSVAVAALWKRMFATDGVLNTLLQKVGIDCSYAWISQPNSAIWVLVLLTVWQFGSSMLIFLSSLKQIPQSLYEAGRVDGANSFKCFWKITLPMLTPTIFFNMVMQMMNGFLAFTQAAIITNGRPLNTTLFYALYMYQQSFEYYKAGYGAAMAWVMLLIIGVFTLIMFATKRLWVYDSDE